MSNKMIGKVAKALFIHDFPNGSLKWEDVDCTEYLLLAKLAIAAMREPTEEMIKAGDDQIEVDPINMWQAMVDAALKE